MPFNFFRQPQDRPTITVPERRADLPIQPPDKLARLLSLRAPQNYDRVGRRDYERLAETWQADPALIEAVAIVESADAGFDQNRRIVLRFESHVFARQSGRQSPAPSGGWQSFEKAAQVDFNAALLATSWGKFQIMGFNAQKVGYQTAEAMIFNFYSGERPHLAAFQKYCEVFGLVEAFRVKNIAEFTKGYNGPGAVRQYSARIEQQWRRIIADRGASA